MLLFVIYNLNVPLLSFVANETPLKEIYRVNQIFLISIKVLHTEWFGSEWFGAERCGPDRRTGSVRRGTETNGNGSDRSGSDRSGADRGIGGPDLVRGAHRFGSERAGGPVLDGATVEGEAPGRGRGTHPVKEAGHAREVEHPV